MNLAGTASALYDAALSLVYPQACRVCGSSVESRVDGVACALCWQKTKTFGVDDLLCWKCGIPAPGNVPDEKRQQVRCHRCDSEPFTAARACGAYEGALRASILALKSEPHVATRLAILLLESQQRDPLRSATRIVPVPLHAERLRERGFNQAEMLARALGDSANLPFDGESLVRSEHTARHRAGMDARARVDSVDRAFVVRRPRLVENETILLIDDVFTSGATASACARVLKDAGALEVFVLTIGRTL